MKIALTFLLWILVGNRIGHTATGRMCTFRAFNFLREVQLNCGSITCHFNMCNVYNHFPLELNATCNSSNCTEDQLSHCQCLGSPTICPACTIPQACLEALRGDPSIQQKICSDSQISHSTSSPMCNSPPTDSEIPNMTSASPKSTTSLSSIMNKPGEPGESLIVISLGVLVGILVVLLVVVTTGWVWTCWTMKRRERNKTNSEQVRTIQNTAYGVIVPASAGQQASSSNEHLGNTRQARDLQGRASENNYYLMGNDLEEEGGEEHEYNVLEGLGSDRHVHQNRELEMKGVKESGEEHAYHVLEGPVGNEHAVHQLEMRGVKESGEEHEYHVLEGPGGDGASREMGRREVGGAMDYEIPLPLKNK